MWNLGEPGARFRAAAPNHPEALLEEPQAFLAVGNKHHPKPCLTPFEQVCLTLANVWKGALRTEQSNRMPRLDILR